MKRVGRSGNNPHALGGDFEHHLAFYKEDYTFIPKGFHLHGLAWLGQGPIVSTNASN